MFYLCGDDYGYSYGYDHGYGNDYDYGNSYGYGNGNANGYTFKDPAQINLFPLIVI